MSSFNGCFKTFIPLKYWCEYRCYIVKIIPYQPLSFLRILIQWNEQITPVFDNLLLQIRQNTKSVQDLRSAPPTRQYWRVAITFITRGRFRPLTPVGVRCCKSLWREVCLKLWPCQTDCWHAFFSKYGLDLLWGRFSMPNNLWTAVYCSSRVSAYGSPETLRWTTGGPLSIAISIKPCSAQRLWCLSPPDDHK